MPQTSITDLPFPTVDLTINMQGVASRMRALIGESVQPMDLYEVYNTATDPDGQPYFWAVNDGTRAKRARNRVMTFFAGGRVINKIDAGPNPPHKMRERTIPLLRSYFVQRVKEAQGYAFKVKNVGTDDNPIWQDIKLGPQQIRTTLTSFDTTVSGIKYTISRIHQDNNLTPAGGATGAAMFWISVMEDCMDYAIALLASFTPVIKEEYQAPHAMTPPAGLLKNSYGWARITDSAGQPESLLKIEQTWLQRQGYRVMHYLQRVGRKVKRGALVEKIERENIDESKFIDKFKLNQDKISIYFRKVKSLPPKYRKTVVGNSGNRITISRDKRLGRLLSQLHGRAIITRTHITGK